MGTVLSVSLRSGLIGAFITVIAAMLLGASSGASFFDNPVGSLTFSGFVFVIALVAGTIATAFCLTLFGLPIAHVLRSSLAAPTGATRAMVSAIAVSVLVAVLISGAPGFAFVLPFSIPAAVLFRREILLENELP